MKVFLSFGLRGLVWMTKLFPSLIVKGSVKWFGPPEIHILTSCFMQRSFFTVRGVSVWLRYEVMNFLSKSSLTRFGVCADLVVVDWVSVSGRFLFNYLLTSISANKSLIVSVWRPVDNVRYISFVSIFPSLNWLEREAGEMFGIKYIGHPSFKPLLLDLGYAGYPMIKLYPVSGFQELFFSEHLKRLVYLSK